MKEFKKIPIKKKKKNLKEGDGAKLEKPNKLNDLDHNKVKLQTEMELKEFNKKLKEQIIRKANK